MTRSLRIAIADDEPDRQEYLQTILPLMGHEVVSVAGTGTQLVEQCREQRPDLIITDIKMPDMDGIDAAQEISADGPVPVILISAYHDPDLLARAEEDHILAYLVKPVKQADLETAIRLAMRRYAQFQLLSQEATTLRQALADRKTIERAKGVLMKWTGMNEADAFARLQKLARDKNRKLIEVAQMIVAVDQSEGKPILQ